jgi:threonyl-tRNA synthetase
MDYAQKVRDALLEKNIRVSIDGSNETLNKRIRNAEVEKIPYCLVVGEREAKQGAVAVRIKGQGDKGSMSLAEFIEDISRQIAQRS